MVLISAGRLLLASLSLISVVILFPHICRVFFLIILTLSLSVLPESSSSIFPFTFLVLLLRSVYCTSPLLEVLLSSATTSLSLLVWLIIAIASACLRSWLSPFVLTLFITLIISSLYVLLRFLRRSKCRLRRDLLRLGLVGRLLNWVGLISFLCDWSFVEVACFLLMSHKVDRCVEELLALDCVVVGRKF